MARGAKRGGAWAVAAGIALFLGAAGAALAQTEQAPGAPGQGPCAMRGGVLTREDREAMGAIFMNRVKERLGFSDQQADEIRAAFRAQRDAARGDFQAMCEGRLELRRLMEQQDADPAALKAAGERVKALQAKLLDRRLETYLALRGKLTPDQWLKWVEFRKERGGPWRGRFAGPRF